MKRLIVMIMILVLTLGVAIMPASADTTGSTHSFKAYQLFTGNMRTDDSGNIYISSAKWGNGVDGDALLATLVADVENFDGAFANAKTAAEVAMILSDFTDNSAATKAFAKMAYTNKVGSGVDVTPGTTKLDAGCYVLVDTTTASGAKNPLILKMADGGVVNIEDKFSTPTVDKKIEEGDALVASTAAGSWETKNFVIKGTTPSNLDDYATYKMTFTDTMDGMSYVVDSVKVYITGTSTPLASDKYVANWDASKKILTVSIANVKSLGVKANQTITVKYQAKLDSSSYKFVNTNSATLTYSSNPNANTEYATTPSSVVKVYSFKLTVRKVDPDNNALEGAGFTLYRKTGTDKTTGAPVYEKVEAISAGAGITSFDFASLGEGDYKLVETTVPEGYTKMDDVEFAISATCSINDVTSLTVTPDTIATANAADGSIAMTVVNDPGNTMPATGGMGTVLFYALGAMLVCGGIVMMMLKKRSAK